MGEVSTTSGIDDAENVVLADDEVLLTVDLDPTIFDRIPSTQQTEAIGQIVLTMLGSLRGIGQVTFTLGGEAVAVKQGNGQLSDVGEPLSYDAFANLLAAPRTSADTTTTTISTTTTGSVSTSLDQ